MAATQVNYAEIVTIRPVRKFLLKFYLSPVPAQRLILVSPIIGTLEGSEVTLEAVCTKAREKNTATYVITRAPSDEHHQRAVDTLMNYERVELRFNQSLHAKLYVCLYEDESKNFGLLGSGNLSRTSIERNIELAMMIYGRGRGRDILTELARWGLERLRTQKSTKVIKKIKLKRR